MESLILSFAAIMLGCFAAAFAVVREHELATVTATGMALTVVASIVCNLVG